MGLSQLVSEPDTEADPENSTEERVSPTLEWILIAIGSVVLALVLRMLLVQSFYIPSGSMEGTLTINDRVLVNKLSYQFSEPSTGDVVVFSRPANLGGDIDNLIKRVVAVGGDTVEGRDGVVFRNGVALDESHLNPGTLTSTFAPVTIPADHVWVMGDSRSNSSDSRMFGPIPLDSVIGRSFVQIWPIQDFELL